MKRTGIIFLVTSFLLSGCSSKSAGNFQILMKDQPVQADKILVTFTEVDVQVTGLAFQAVWTGSQTVDLIQLKTSQATLVDTELNQGTYTQIRLIVSSGQVVIGGTTYEMDIPSSEVRIPVNFEILKDQMTKIILDFDDANSIQVVSARGSDKYILRPVIHFDSVVF